MESVITLREPSVQDAAEVWSLLHRAGGLDVNTPYCYLLLCDMFRSSCVIAESDGKPVGFVSAFVKPENMNILFVWQAAVDPAHQGKGIGRSMLNELLNRSYIVPIRYLEATVGESNTASRRMFEAFAAARDTHLQNVDGGGYPSELFPGHGHEPEPLVRIGPFLDRQPNR